MIYSYMERETEELEKKLDTYLMKKKNIDTLINEKRQYIAILLNSTDQMATNFSPYDVNKTTIIMVDNIKEELSKLTIKSDRILLDIEQMRCKVCEYRNISNEIKKLELLHEVDEEQEALLKSKLEYGIDGQQDTSLSIDDNQDIIVKPGKLEAVNTLSSMNGLGDIDYASYRLKILETQENERQRIAMDIHDEPLQELTAMIHKVEYCSRIVDSDQIQTKLELMNIQKSLHKVINGTRSIIYDLKPMSLNDIGFEETLARELKKIESFNDVKITLKSPKIGEEFSEVIRTTLYRIIQEACWNAIKHGNPDEIMVILEVTDQDIHIEIQDNGRGFDISQVNNQSDCLQGFGMTTMKERIFLLSGKLTIESELGKGTIIKVQVPFVT